MGHKYTKILPPEEVPEAEGATPPLYLGSIDYIVEDDILDELGVNCIVAVLPHPPTLIEEVLEKHKIPSDDFALYPLEDNRQEYISLFEDPGIIAIADFIHSRRKQGKVVLVHCDAGITRSPAVVIAYIMKFGKTLNQPTRVTYRDAYNYVRSLRESLDIVMFSGELQEVEKRLQELPVTDQLPALSAETLKMLHPTSPLNRLDGSSSATFSDSHGRRSMEQADHVNLTLLQDTWREVKNTPGGAEAFGASFYRNLLRIGGRRFTSMFSHVNMDIQASMMTKMLAQFVTGFVPADIQRLVRSHRSIGVISEDFDVFTEAMLETLSQTAKTQWSAESASTWRNFMTQVFDKWKHALANPPPESPAAEEKSPKKFLKRVPPTLQAVTDKH